MRLPIKKKYRFGIYYSIPKDKICPMFIFNRKCCDKKISLLCKFII